MKIQGRVLLVALFLAGLGGLWLADYLRVPDQDRLRLLEPRVLPELIDLRPDELRRIEILGGSETLTLQREEGSSLGWRLVSPINASADPSLVENLALNLKTMAKSRDAGGLTMKEAAAYGLAPAERTIKLWGSATDKPLATLEVGRQVRDRRYVHNINGSNVEVVESQTLSALELTPKAWRDRAIFHLPTFQVESIEATRPDGSVTIRRSGEDWRIEKPWSAPADSASIENTVAALASLRVLTGEAGFVAHQVSDFAPYGLDKPELTVILRGGGREPGRLDIGKPAPRPDDPKLDKNAELRFARRDGGKDVLVVDARPFIGFARSAAEIRSKFVAKVPFPRVDYITITQEGSEVALARTSRGWSRVKPTVDEADSQAVVKLVRAVTDLQTSLLLPADSVPNSGLDKPTAVIRLWRDSSANRTDASTRPPEAPTVELKIGRRDVTKKTVYVKAGEEPNILAVPDSILTSLPRGPLAFRSRQILALASNLVDRFTVEGGPIRYVLQAPPKPSPKGWRITVPCEAPIDQESLGRLLLVMNNLRAESFITLEATDLKPYGLDKPWRMLSWTLRPEPGRPQTPSEIGLVVGKVADPGLGSRYAKLTSSPVVFTLGPEQVATLDAEFRDRVVLTSDMMKVRALRLRWRSGLDQTLEPIDDRTRNARDWIVTRPVPTLGMDTKDIPQLLSALERVRAVRFVQFDGPIPAAAGLTPAKFEIELAEHPALPSKRLRIGGYSPDGYLFATTAEGSEGPIFLLPIGTWEPLSKTPKLNVELPTNP